MMTTAPVPASACPVHLTAGALAAAVGGTLRCGSPDTVVGPCSIDSRTLKPGDLFLAIRGDRFDGHDFVAAALAAGAGGVVVSETSVDPAARAGAFVVRVADTTRALQGLARFVRRTSGTTVIGVTGSAGKTTTKDLAADVLGLRFNVYRSQGNFNNHIGLPLSLMHLRQGYQVAVVELGMNHAGELSTLTALSEPDVRVWTNVAEVHTEFFTSIDAIAAAKAEILEGATPDTLVVANAADPRVMAHVRRCPARVLTFGVDADADVSARDVQDLGLGGTRAAIATPAGAAVLDVPLIGRGHLANALAATAVGLAFGVPLDDIVGRVRTSSASAHRGEILRLRNQVTVVDDSYNSNPRAVERMLEALAATPAAGRRVAVLGEMLELGEQATALHQACGRAVAGAGVSVFIAVGGESARAMAYAAVEAGLAASAVDYVASSAEAAGRLERVVRPGDVVLVKGSHGIHTDVVVERLKVMLG
jgi:UDP-N-acetylmuramoyl-tripeptide--D-alanyl-D-alanine ligase